MKLTILDKFRVPIEMTKQKSCVHAGAFLKHSEAMNSSLRRLLLAAEVSYHPLLKKVDGSAKAFYTSACSIFVEENSLRCSGHVSLAVISTEFRSNAEALP